MKEASETTMKGVLGYTTDQVIDKKIFETITFSYFFSFKVVSNDFVGDPRSSIFDQRAGERTKLKNT